MNNGKRSVKVNEFFNLKSTNSRLISKLVNMHSKRGNNFAQFN